MLWLILLSCLAAVGPPATTVSSESLRRQTDAELLESYEKTALAAGATDARLAQGNPADRAGMVR